MKTIIPLLVGCIICLQANAQVSCDPPPSGIVSWWPAEGNANDIIGANNGALEGGLGFASGEVGQAFSFTTNNQDVKIPASSSLDVGAGNGFTLEAWINCSNIDVPNPIFEWNVGDGTTYWGVHFYVGTSPGALYANVVDTSGVWHQISSASGVVASNVFQHVALTYDKTSGAAVIYCNGIIVAQSSLGSYTPLTTFPLYLGRRIGPDAYFTFSGLIDEASIYNRALSSSEITAIYQAGSAGKCSGSGLPVITTQPTNQIAPVNGTATFAVTAAGASPLFYQWQFDGTNLPAATNSTLILSNLSLSQSGTYDVVVTNYLGSVTSTPAMLNIMFILVEVNGQPVTSTNPVTALSPATITILGGYPSGYIFYTLDGSAPTFNSTLYTGPFALTNSAVIQTMAASSSLSQTSNGIPVTVQIVPAYALQTSIIGSGTLSTNPPGGVYASNTVVTLTATPALHWAFAYWTNDATGSQNPVSVTMNGPRNVQAVFVQTAFPLTLTTPGGGSLTANGVAIPPTTYYPAGTMVTLNATPNSGWVFLGWQGTVNSTNNPLNLVINQTNNIQGIFGTVAVTNATGGAVVLSQPNPVPYGTYLTISAVPNPGNYFVNWSGNLSGLSPYSPVRYNVTVANPTFGALFTPLPTGKFSLAAVVNGPGFVTLSPLASYYSSNATVSLTASPNAGNYFFGWSQGATGRNSPLSVQVTSNTIIQANFGVTPTVSISPMNQTVMAGGNAGITASAMGLPPLTNQWQNSQGAIPGANNATYTIFNTQPTNAGNYSVVVSSSVGSVTSAWASVTVVSTPSITNQPAPEAVTVGHSASFAVGAYGAPVLAYQWQLNGTNLAGATNPTLTFPNAFPANGGSYTVTVTNVYGSATSYPALLTVLPLDIIVPSKLANGQFQFTFDTASGINYQVQYSTNLLNWYLWLTVGGNGQPLTLTDPNTSGAPQRFYRILLSQ